MTDNGEVNYMLGIKISMAAAGARLSQTAYINGVLERFGMSGCASVPTPMTHAGSELGPREDGKATKTEIHDYASMLGCLLWIAQCTRPDISYAVSKLARYMANPSLDHFKAAKRILRYLSGTSNLGLVYTQSNAPQISAYSDSDFAQDRSTRRSVSAYTVYLHGNLISWRSRLQPTVTVSTAEAEYLALSEAGREVRWIISLLGELHFSLRGPAPIFTDNQGAEAISKNPESHGRTKHIPTHHHLIRDYQKAGYVQVGRVGTNDNPADILTKAASPARFADGVVQLKLQPVVNDEARVKGDGGS